MFNKLIKKNTYTPYTNSINGDVKPFISLGNKWALSAPN